MVVRIETARL